MTVNRQQGTTRQRRLQRTLASLLLLVGCAAPVVEPQRPATVAECDCMWYAYTALKRIGIRLRTVPAVVISGEHGGHGFYLRGMVGVPDNQDCKVMVHEFVHEYQYERYGEQVGVMWWLNEAEANEKAARAINLAGECR